MNESYWRLWIHEYTCNRLFSSADVLGVNSKLPSNFTDCNQVMGLPPLYGFLSPVDAGSMVFTNPKSPWPCMYPLGASVPIELVHKRISNLNSLHTLQLEASSNICLTFKSLSVGLKWFILSSRLTCVSQTRFACLMFQMYLHPSPSSTTPFYTICALCSLGPLHIWLQAGVMPFLLIWSHLVICSVFLRSDWKLFLF